MSNGIEGRTRDLGRAEARPSEILRRAKGWYGDGVMAEQILAGKVGLVFGVANKRSIAWAIAKAWAAAGAKLIFNYQGERLKENVEELVGEFGEGTPLTLTGPGVNGKANLGAKPLPHDFLVQWAANRARFPLGVDLILASEAELVGLPRSIVISGEAR